MSKKSKKQNKNNKSKQIIKGKSTRKETKATIQSGQDLSSDLNACVTLEIDNKRDTEVIVNSSVILKVKKHEETKKDEEVTKGFRKLQRLSRKELEQLIEEKNPWGIFLKFLVVSCIVGFLLSLAGIFIPFNIKCTDDLIKEINGYNTELQLVNEFGEKVYTNGKPTLVKVYVPGRSLIYSNSTFKTLCNYKVVQVVLIFMFIALYGCITNIVKTLTLIILTPILNFIFACGNLLWDLKRFITMVIRLIIHKMYLLFKILDNKFNKKLKHKIKGENKNEK